MSKVFNGVRTRVLRILVPLQRRSPDERTVDDIDDPNAYSIEDAKLKAEHDKMIRDAEAKKLAERRRIEKLRRSFLDLLRQNDELPENFRLEREVGLLWVRWQGHR